MGSIVVSLEVDNRAFRDMMTGLEEQQSTQDTFVYFYHGDHLGSASWITNHAGIAVQHLQYLPFGESYVDQHPAGYQERYRFTGREKTFSFRFF